MCPSNSPPVLSRTLLAVTLAIGAAAGVACGAERIQPEQDRLPVIFLGYREHGTTALVSAITMAQLGRRVSRTEARVDTDLRRYTLRDFPTEQVEAAFAAGAILPAGAVVVVSGTDGPMPRTREHVLAAREAGIPSIIVFIDKVDQQTDPDLLDLVERETRELLRQAGFAGEPVTVIRGSSLKALESGDPGSEWGRQITALLNAMDREFFDPRAEGG